MHEVESMAYLGEVPWHGLGTRVDGSLAPNQMATAAGLDWEVAVAPLNFQTGPSAAHRPLTSHRALYRTDTMQALDVVGNGYVPTQNREVLEFFREFVEAGEMTLETAGALCQGKYVWALARMNKGFTLGQGDRVNGYVLLMNPHQYGKSLIAKFCAIRVVCFNTLTMALDDRRGKSVAVPHIRAFGKEERQDAQRRLGFAVVRLHELEETAKVLSRYTLTAIDAQAALERILQTERRPFEKHGPRLRRIVELFSGAGRGSDLQPAAGTAWGLLNSVTEYVDWKAGRTPDGRMLSAWLTRGEQLKNTTLQHLLELSTSSNDS